MNELDPAPPPADEQEVSRFSLWFLRFALIAVTLVVLAFIVHAAWPLFGGDDDAGTDSTTTTTTTTTTTVVAAGGDGGESSSTPSSSASAPATSDDAEAQLQAFVDEAIAFIEGERGAPFLERPVVELVPSAEFAERLVDLQAEDFVENADEYAEGTVLQRAFGLIGPDQTSEEVAALALSAGAGGVYFPETDELWVRGGGELNLAVKNIVIHELVHAYDDQYFDLDRFDEFDPATEDAFTFIALVEGSASLLESRWVATQGPDAESIIAEQSLELGDPDVFFQLDVAYLLLDLAVYFHGEPHVASLVEREGFDGYAAALADPPQTSEQIIEAHDAPNLEPVVVAAPEVDGEVVYSGVGGQVLLDALFESTFVIPTSASQGWGGDALVAYRRDGVECVRWDIATDSEADRDELVAGLRELNSRRGGAVSLVGDLVRYDRCAR